AIGLDDKKLAWARDFGATHTVNASREDAVSAVQEATGGLGADVCIEAVGHPEVLRQAFFARDLAGTLVQVGVPTPDMTFPDIPMIEFFGRGGALKPSWYGDCLPSRDFPHMIELYLQGRLDLDRQRRAGNAATVAYLQRDQATTTAQEGAGPFEVRRRATGTARRTPAPVPEPDIVFRDRVAQRAGGAVRQGGIDQGLLSEAAG